MPGSGWAFCFSAARWGGKAVPEEDLALEQTYWGGIRRGIRRGWPSAVCALGLACVCIPAATAGGQASVASEKKAAATNQAAATKPENPKKHVKVAANTSGTRNSTSPKASTALKSSAHAASYPASGAHAKSNSVAASRDLSSKTKQANARKAKKKTARGQQKIDFERAQEIQTALIREHYLTGDATGTWNQASEDAMRRYQSDHGWQCTTVPDARALISLGLGPSNDHLLNPESAMTSGPEGLHAGSLSSVSQSPASHSADPGAPMNTNPIPPADPATGTTSGHDAPGPQ